MGLMGDNTRAGVSFPRAGRGEADPRGTITPPGGVTTVHGVHVRVALWHHGGDGEGAVPVRVPAVSFFSKMTLSPLNRREFSRITHKILENFLFNVSKEDTI